MSRYTQRSFTGGELSPALYARNDLAKYAIGLKTLKNGFVRAEGCVSNRAGLELVCEVKNSSSKVRLIPFSFNTEQTYIIELGDKYARFIKNGAQILNIDETDENTPVEITTEYEQNDLFNIKYAQNAARTPLKSRSSGHAYKRNLYCCYQSGTADSSGSASVITIEG